MPSWPLWLKEPPSDPGLRPEEKADAVIPASRNAGDQPATGTLKVNGAILGVGCVLLDHQILDDDILGVAAEGHRRDAQLHQLAGRVVGEIGAAVLVVPLRPTQAVQRGPALIEPAVDEKILPPVAELSAVFAVAMEVQRLRKTVCLPQSRDVGPGRQFHGTVEDDAVLADKSLPVFRIDRLLAVDARFENKSGSLGGARHDRLNVLPGSQDRGGIFSCARHAARADARQRRPEPEGPTSPHPHDPVRPRLTSGTGVRLARRRVPCATRSSALRNVKASAKRSGARHSMPRRRASPRKVSASNHPLERWVAKCARSNSTLRSSTAEVSGM